MSLTREQKLGGIFAASAYTLWGIAPLYFKQIDSIPAPEILIHRIVWSFLLLLLVIVLLRQGRETLALFAKPKLLCWLLLSSLLLGGNWLLFIWAVNNGHVIETSLGYFINPLVSVALGVIVLKEKLRTLQKVAVGLTFIAVSFLTLTLGHPPYIALSLAFSFGFYGLVKKWLM